MVKNVALAGLECYNYFAYAKILTAAGSAKHGTVRCVGPDRPGDLSQRSGYPLDHICEPVWEEAVWPGDAWGEVL